ncbi:MAG TPA: YihY/virulence factor BrkB family protein [Solirubrobacteraceae bacterium]|nr:YihY/virulence factor BrkB family protein [Solirubrobacteraceae bacterium]
MDFQRLTRRFDAYQQSHRWLAVPMAVIKKSSDDQGGNLAALMAWFGFFSLFPLLLVFATILGYVLAGDPATRHSVEHSVTSQFPAVGTSLPLNSISGSVGALIFGVLAALYAGLGVTNAAQSALDTVWAVPFKNRPNFIKSRLRGLGLLAFLGVLFIVSTVASGAVSAGFGGPLAKLAGYLLSLMVNFGLFFAAYRLMTIPEIPSGDLKWGSVVAAVLWTILQSVGGLYLKHASGGSYGVFAVVIPLLIWLRLGAQVFLYCAQINAVVSRRLWPRSFFGPPEAPADQRTLRALAKVEERSEEQQVDVEFKTPRAEN